MRLLSTIFNIRVIAQSRSRRWTVTRPFNTICNTNPNLTRDLSRRASQDGQEVEAKQGAAGAERQRGAGPGVGPQVGRTARTSRCCPVLAHRWEGVGPIPTQLVPLLLSETWNDPAVLPSLQARRRIGESCATPEKFDRLMKGSFTPVRDGWTRAWTDVVSDAGRPDLGKHF